MEKRIITEEDIRRFAIYMKEEEKSSATIEKYLRDIRHFMAFAGGRQITKEVTMAYKESIGDSYAPASANSMIAAVNSFCKFMEWDDCRVKRFKLQRKIYSKEDEELSKEEYKRLVSAAKRNGNQRLSLILQTICSTGIRVSELEYITVDALRKKEAIVNCKGKQRIVLLVPDLTKKLIKYARNKKIISGPIFVTRTGKPISRCNIWKEMKQLCKDAEVPSSKVFPHNLRHLFAKIFYELEKDIAKLADILGHSSINTTRIYIMTTAQVHRRQMEMMKLII